MTQNQQRSLVRKMSEIMKEVGRVPKNGYNEFHKYKYVKEEDILEVLREKMAEKNVMIFQNLVEKDITVSGTDAKPKFLTSIKMEYTIMDGDSGEQIVISQGGQGEDAGDKGIYKATTGANKYVLMKLFMIPTGDDPELDGQQPNRPSGNNQNDRKQQNQSNTGRSGGQGYQNNRKQNNSAQSNVSGAQDGVAKAKFQKLFGADQLPHYTGFAAMSGMEELQLIQWMDKCLEQKKEIGRKITRLVKDQGGTNESAAEFVRKQLYRGLTFEQMYDSLLAKQKKKSGQSG